MLTFKKFTGVLLVQAAIIILVAFDFLPETSLIIMAAALVFLVLILDLSSGATVFIASLPLLTVFPVLESSDSFAVWRVLVFVLFLKWIWIYAAKKNAPVQCCLIDYLKKFPPLIFPLILAATLVLSLSVAPYPLIGLKKIFFLINALMIVPPVFYAASSRRGFHLIQKGVVAAVFIIVGVATLQIFLTSFFLSLYDFWQFWAEKFIPIFYGRNLADLLAVSNTWFSYYSDFLPTLRAFSVFPDSHSFALFLVLALPILVYYGYQKMSFDNNFWPLVLALVSLTGIILSGSRGAWVSAAMVLVFFAVFAAVLKLQGRFHKIFMAPIAVLAIFFILFVPASLLISTTRENFQSGGGTTLAFERFKTVSQKEETSNLGRMEIWKFTLVFIADHPWLGAGVGNYALVLQEDISAVKRGASAHNLYLDLAAESGIPAALALLALFLSILLSLWRKIKENIFSDKTIFYVIFGMSFLWMAAYGLFDVVLLNDKVLLLFLAVTAMVFAPPESGIESKESEKIPNPRS